MTKNTSSDFSRYLSNVKVVPLGELYIHEEIIPSILDEILRSLHAEKIQKDPVIVDRESNVVLDGMHRVAALKELGADKILALLVDYSSPSVQVKSWCRSIKDLGREELVSRLKSMGLAFSRGDRRRRIRLFFPEETYSFDVEASVEELSHLVKKIEDQLKSCGARIEYDVVEDAVSKLKKGEVEAVISLPEISKEDVVRVARSGQVFAHKSTRHIIPMRVLRVNFPIEYLMPEHTLEEANETLARILKSKKPRLLPPGSVLDRRYEEEVILLE